jgi:uncharacterized cupin superfamily protein
LPEIVLTGEDGRNGGDGLCRRGSRSAILLPHDERRFSRFPPIDHHGETMRKQSARPLGSALAVCAAFWAGTTARAADDSPAPVRLDPDKIAGLGLTAIPPDAYQEILVAGTLNMRVASLFEGKELRVSIFESTPAKTSHRTRPTDVDEFVYVLSGKLILTEPDGKVHEYLPGDSLVLPVGYKGTWEMQGNYRELVVLAQKGD